MSHFSLHVLLLREKLDLSAVSIDVLTEVADNELKTDVSIVSQMDFESR